MTLWTNKQSDILERVSNLLMTLSDKQQTEVVTELLARKEHNFLRSGIERRRTRDRRLGFERREIAERRKSL